MIPDKDLTFQLNFDLDSYGFGVNDSVKNIFDKYFSLHYFIPSEVKARIDTIIDPSAPTGVMGEVYSDIL